MADDEPTEYDTLAEAAAKRLGNTHLTPESISVKLLEDKGALPQESEETPSPEESSEPTDVEDEEEDAASLLPLSSEDEEGEEEASTPSSPNSFRLPDGREVSLDELTNLINLAEVIRRDPLTATQIGQLIDGQVEVVPKGNAAPTEEVSVTPPPELDLEDPTVAFLYNELQRQRSQIQSYLPAIQRHDEILSNRELSESKVIYERAYSSFQKDHGLTDEEMKRIDTTAASLNVLPGLITDRHLPRLDAITEAFKIGMRVDDTLYQRDVERQAAEDRKIRVKKAKANSVASGSGSAPRVAPTSKSNNPRAAMVDAFKEMMGQNAG